MLTPFDINWIHVHIDSAHRKSHGNFQSKEHHFLGQVGTLLFLSHHEFRPFKLYMKFQIKIIFYSKQINFISFYLNKILKITHTKHKVSTQSIKFKS